MTNTLLRQTISMGEALSVSVTGIIVVMIILALLAVIVVLLSKAVRTVEGKAKKKSKSNTAQENAITPVKNENKIKSAVNGQALPETQSAGSLDLYKTDEKTAAVIMAIVSNESGIPLNRLQFNSIKLIEE